MTAFRSRRTEAEEQGFVAEEKRLFEAPGEIPKLPRNETLYHILKTGTLSVNKIVFDLNYVFDEVAARLRGDTFSPSVELLFDIDEALPTHLIGSPKRLSRVLINLLDNALRYSDRGVVVMEVRVLHSDGVDCRLGFTVRDQGRGMARDELNRLGTDPEQRTVNGKTPYGCYVAHAIAVAEGGSLKIESVPGAGTAVQFDMLFKEPQTHAKGPVRKPTAKCASLRVAVVTAHDQTARLLKKYLEAWVEEVSTVVIEKPLLATAAVDGCGMVIVDHRLCGHTTAYALKSRGVDLVMLRDVLRYVPGEGHQAADYLLSVPFLPVHLTEMLRIFHGEQNAPAAAARPADFDRFVSDGDIPSAAVRRNDFERFMGAKLLIVEDNPIILRMLQGLLGDSGILLFFAENGKDALDLAAEEAPFDLVLMDLNIPAPDGLETTRLLREMPRFASLPIVALTGLNRKELVQRMQEVGMNAHLSKPLDIGRLYTLFGHFLPVKGPGA